jgi:hypothetical protein
MLRSDADAPKPPAYPFITNQSQRARTQNMQHTRTSGVPAVVPPDFVAVVFAAASAPFRLRFRVWSVSVRGLLRPHLTPRKQKMTGACRFFPTPRKRLQIRHFGPALSPWQRPDRRGRGSPCPPKSSGRFPSGPDCREESPRYRHRQAQDRRPARGAGCR